MAFAGRGKDVNFLAFVYDSLIVLSDYVGFVGVLLCLSWVLVSPYTTHFSLHFFAGLGVSKTSEVYCVGDT